ncbi:MAG: hypothetical protein WKG07_49555 [Hymenobacter sp.]
MRKNSLPPTPAPSLTEQAGNPNIDADARAEREGEPRRDFLVKLSLGLGGVAALAVGVPVMSAVLAPLLEPTPKPGAKWARWPILWWAPRTWLSLRMPTLKPGRARRASRRPGCGASRKRNLSPFRSTART